MFQKSLIRYDLSILSPICFIIFQTLDDVHCNIKVFSFVEVSFFIFFVAFALVFYLNLNAQPKVINI